VIGVTGTVAFGTRGDPQATTQVGSIIHRTAELDDVIARSGIDPNDINIARTPLIGASHYAEIAVLVLLRSETSDPGVKPFDASATAEMVGSSEERLYSVLLYEPNAAGGGSAGGGEKPPAPPGPDIGSGDAGPEAPVLPDLEPDIGPSNPNLTQRLASVATPPNQTLQAFRFGRQIRWTMLTLVDATEILSSVASFGRLSTNPATPGFGGSLYVLRFVDARARLCGQTMYSQGNTRVAFGRTRDQWNMIADNPLHLVGRTVKAIQYFPPSLNPPQAIPANYHTDDLDRGRMVGLPAPSPWYSETPYTAKDIIDAYVAETQWTALDRMDIQYEYSNTASQEERKGDMLNLDLRGRNVGEALDEIAARIGCVWVWDRYASRLTLRPLTFNMPGSAQSPYPMSAFLLFNLGFRTGGGLNQIPNALPNQRWATVHPVRRASVWGSAPTSDSRVYCDWRALSSPDGVRGISMESSERPPLFYQISTVGTGRTQFVGDHVPAYWGIQNSQPAGEDWMAVNYSEARFTIWNHVRPTPACAWWDKPWAVTLAERGTIIQGRYDDGGRIQDGDLITNRIPAYGDIQPMMRETPSAGLQFDEVRFGQPGMAVQYRIYGSKTSTLLFPHLMRPERVKALNLGSAYHASGCVNLQRIDRRGGIVRVFLCKFKKHDYLYRRTVGSNQVEVTWLYRIEEVAPEKILEPSWLLAHGEYEFDGVDGYAMNLCELDGAASDGSTYLKNFDGGTLNYTTNGSQITRTDPAGIAPCYEYVAPSGFTMYYLFAPNGVSVTCATPGSPSPLPFWENSGASGSAFATFDSINQSIEGSP